MAARPLDHVAILVGSIEPALEALAPLGLEVGPVETFEGEGTREVYLGPAGRPARLLLMAPCAAVGPYAAALARRGPGLHHLAFDVPDLDPFLDQLPGSGWYLHPVSHRTVPAGRTAWLARPGVGTLVEVQERTSTDPTGPPIVEAVEIPSIGAPGSLWPALDLAGVVPSTDGATSISIGGRRGSPSDLWTVTGEAT